MPLASETGQPSSRAAQNHSTFSHHRDLIFFLPVYVIAMSKTMKAVVFKGPLKVEIEDRPVPTIQDPQDIVLKVEYSALCGRSFCPGYGAP
jgi:hypothetical protein